MFTNAKVADYRSPAWEVWRIAEKASDKPFRYCKACGFVHRVGNHAPQKETR